MNLRIDYTDNLVYPMLSGYRVKYVGCGMQGPVEETRDKAIDAWNTLACFNADLKGASY